MTSRSFRGDGIPKNIIIWYNESGSLPDGWVHECTLFDKYLKGIPNSCTNPGAVAGSNTHCDPSFCLTHSHTTFCSSHTHETTWASPTVIRCCGPHGLALTDHTHQHVTSTSSTANIITNSSVLCHNHNNTSVNHEPLHKTIRNIKYTRTSRGFRRRGTPFKSILLDSRPLTCKPSDYNLINTGNKFLKGVSSSCATPDVCGGTASHSHTKTSGSHTHTFTISSHTHTASGTSQSSTSSFSGGGGLAEAVENVSHTHTGTISLGCVTAVTSTSDGNHTHPAVCNTPPYHEVAYYKRKSLSMRRNGFPLSSIVSWLGTLACIPSGFKLANGVCASVNLLGKFVRSVVNSCTNPGSTGGFTSHQHPSVSHNHANTPTHRHSTSGTSSDHSGLPITGRPGGFCTGSVATVFPCTTHSASSTSSNDVVTLPCGGSHQHASVNIEPSHKEVAWIIRI